MKLLLTTHVHIMITKAGPEPLAKRSFQWNESLSELGNSLTYKTIVFTPRMDLSNSISAEREREGGGVGVVRLE